jgi:hypothetical protein
MRGEDDDQEATDRFCTKRAGIDERREDLGPPRGNIERRESRISRPSGPDTDNVFERVERNIKPVAVITGSLMALVTALSTYGILNMPLETKAHAADVFLAQARRDDQQDRRMDELQETGRTQEARLDRIERTGLLSLQLQIQGRITDIEREAKGLPETSGAARALIETKLDLQQQLDEVKRSLRR